MTAEDNPVGRGLPPKDTRWKKGQCGNPKNIRKRKPQGLASLIDDSLSKLAAIAVNGQRRHVTVFEAILHQLFLQEMTGNKKALAVRLRYENAAPPDPKDVKLTVIGGLPTDDGERR